MIEAFFLSLGQLLDPRIARVFLKSIALTVVLFAAAGVGLWYSMHALEGWTAEWMGAPPSGWVADILTILIFFTAWWLLFRAIAIAVIGIFGDEVVAAVEVKHYPAAHAQARDVPFGVYVHVPFCRTRCGYCDFNTYTATELGPGVSQGGYADTLLHEVRLAADVLAGVTPEISTVFFGGGTPTLLPAEHLGVVITELRERFGLADDVEITTEANPETVTPGYFARLREAGFTRVSIGMQSAVPRVLAVLDRARSEGSTGLPAARAADEAASLLGREGGLRGKVETWLLATAGRKGGSGGDRCAFSSMKLPTGGAVSLRMARRTRSGRTAMRRPSRWVTRSVTRSERSRPSRIST